MPSDVVHSLATRIHRLEIRSELTDLVARYGQALDSRDWGAAAGCFTQEGALSFGDTTATGHAALKELFAASLERYEFTFHYPHAHSFDITADDHASGLVTGHAEHSLRGTCLLAGVRYRDNYIREDGHWRFARREVDSRYLLSWPEFATGFHEGAVSTALSPQT